MTALVLATLTATVFAVAFIITLIWTLKMRRSMKRYYDLYIDDHEHLLFTSKDELARKVGFLCEKIRLMEEGRKERQ